jgi:hypothetical protein
MARHGMASCAEFLESGEVRKTENFQRNLRTMCREGLLVETEPGVYRETASSSLDRIVLYSDRAVFDFLEAV